MVTGGPAIHPGTEGVPGRLEAGMAELLLTWLE